MLLVVTLDWVSSIATGNLPLVTVGVTPRTTRTTHPITVYRPLPHV